MVIIFLYKIINLKDWHRGIDYQFSNKDYLNMQG